MIKWIVAVLVLSIGVAYAQYFDGLPVASSVSTSDITAVCQGGTGAAGTCTTRQATVAKLLANAGGGLLPTTVPPHNTVQSTLLSGTAYVRGY